jgi:hypothetical protein
MFDKVRKLLAKAENPACPPAEAEALTAKATELIAKYGIDNALLVADHPEVDRVKDRAVRIHPPYASEKARLLQVVAKGMRCRAVALQRRADGVRQFSVHLFGFGTDLSCVELLHDSLLAQASHALAVEPVPAGAHPTAWRRSWLTGFTTAIGVRLRDSVARATMDGPSRVALVLVDRGHRVDQMVAVRYPDLAVPRRRRLSGTGFALGQAAGHRADLGARRLTVDVPGVAVRA